MQVNLGNGGHLSRYFSTRIKTNKTKDLICAWIRAYIDDEGYVDLKTRRIAITSINKNGLRDVKDLLEFLGVSCKVYKIMGGYAYRLIISGTSLARLVQCLKPLHPEKNRRLQELLLLHGYKTLKGSSDGNIRMR